MKTREEILARKQYEDVVKNSRPFWYIKLITLHPKKLLCGLFALYFAATLLTVELGLLDLGTMQNEDFFIASDKNTPLYFTH